MARCNDCGKFVGLEEGEPEIEGEVEVDGNAVSATVNLSRNCVDCGTELKQGSFELGDDVAFDAGCIDDKGHEWECVSDSPEFTVTDRMDDQGGKIKHQRFMKRMIGVEGTIELTCTRCKAATAVELKDEMSASNFDDV
jgi:tartrate dehydratase beta subunit/fumarate hydratase class I family protein